MKRLYKHAIVTLLAGVFPLFVFSADILPSTGTFVYKRASMRDLEGYMRSGLGIKVAFAETPYADAAKLITNKELLNETYAIPKDDRTEREKHLITELEGAITSNPGIANGIFPEEKRFTLDIPKVVTSPDAVEKLMQLITHLDDRYSWTKSNTILIMSDKESLVNKDLISYKVTGVTINTACTQLMNVLGAKNIDVNVSQEVRKRGGTITLNLDNVTLAEAFSRFAEELGPDITWQLLESQKTKFLLFNKVTVSPDRWETCL